MIGLVVAGVIGLGIGTAMGVLMTACLAATNLRLAVGAIEDLRDRIVWARTALDASEAEHSCWAMRAALDALNGRTPTARPREVTR